MNTVADLIIKEMEKYLTKIFGKVSYVGCMGYVIDGSPEVYASIGWYTEESDSWDSVTYSIDLTDTSLENKTLGMDIMNKLLRVAKQFNPDYEKRKQQWNEMDELPYQ